MKKGLLLTLVMVAIALSGYRAMGRAPVVSEIRDIIVGDEHEATPAKTFVYPTKINLNDIVSDPDGTDADIVWSFFEGSGTYIINGVQSQSASSGQQIISPLPELRIAGAGVTANDELDTDSTNITITVRNQVLSPIGGPNVAPDPDVDGIVADSAKLITLFASDGSTVGLNDAGELPTFVAYTGNNMDDQTSPAETNEPVKTWTFVSTNNAWSTKKEQGTVTFTTSANGVCLEAPDLGNNIGEFSGQYGEDPTYGLTLVKNSVWRCRVTAHNAGNAAGSVPLFMFLYDNANTFDEYGAGRFGANCYGGEFVFLDTDGANTLGVDRTEYECWIAPNCFRTPQWNDDEVGPFTAGWDAYKDMRIRFRIFDLATGPNGQPAGYGAENDHGQVCLDQVRVDRYLFSDMQRGEEVYNLDVMATPTWRVIAATGSTTVNNDADGLRLTPVIVGGKGWADGTIQVVPGDGSLGDYNTSSTAVDDYPVDWENNTLYMVEVDMSCPTPSTPENQGDIIRLGMDSANNELGYMNLIVNGFDKAGTPKPTRATYTSFLYSHGRTFTEGYSSLSRLRPRIDILNVTGVGDDVNRPKDPTKFHNCKVTKVIFQ